MTQIAKADFPLSTWDGLCFQYDNLLTDSDPSFFWQDKATIEIQAIEDYLISYEDLFTFFDNLGPANSVVGVKADQSNLTYRELVAGLGVSIVQTDSTTTISSNSSSTVLTIVLTNSDSIQVTKGMPVYSFNNGEFKRGKANNVTTNKLIGLAHDDINTSASGEIQTDGVLMASTVQWDALTGDSGGLTVNSLYYLSETTAGNLKLTVPITGYVSPVGIAISSTQMKIGILNTVLL